MLSDLKFGGGNIVFRNDISASDKLNVLLFGRGDCC